MAHAGTRFPFETDSDSRISRGLAPREQRSATSVSSIKTPSDALLNSFGLPAKSGAVVNADTAMTVSTVYAAVTMVSGLLARLPIQLRRSTSAGCDILGREDHPAIDLVCRSPDGHRTAFSWRQSCNARALIRGNGPSRIFRDAYFQPSQLGWMNPAEFEIWMTPEGEPFYRYRGQVLRSWEVLNRKDFTLDGISGVSAIDRMREQIGLAITTQEHGARHFSNGAQPGVVLTAPLGATKQQMDMIRDEVNKNHAGVANSGRPFIAYGGLTVSTVSLSNADSQFLESRKFDVEEIARAFRVPKHLLQSNEGATSWGTGLEQLNRAFIDFSLADRIAGHEEELDMGLLSEADKDAGLYFKLDTSELTAGSNKDRADYYQIMRNVGAMSVNDVREREGMNDLPDHLGDRYDLPFNGNGGTNAEKSKADAAAQKQEAA